MRKQVDRREVTCLKVTVLISDRGRIQTQICLTLKLVPLITMLYCLPWERNSLGDYREKKAEQNNYNSATFPFDPTLLQCLNTPLRKYLAQPTHPRDTEIIFTGLYDLTKLYGHCWIPLGKNPGTPTSPHDSAGHRAKIFQTASNKVSDKLSSPQAFSASLPLSSQLKGQVHMYKWSPTPIKLSGFTLAGQRTFRPFQGNHCFEFPKDSSGKLIKCKLVSSAPRSQSVDQEWTQESDTSSLWNPRPL